MYNREIAIKESIQEKCKRRDEQAKLIMEIIELAKKLKHATCELSKIIRYPEFIGDDDIEVVRKKLDITFWHDCLNEYQVEKYLTTTDKEKLFENLENNSPVFNYDNVMNTINKFMTSKDATATAMIKKIYEEVTNIVFSKGNKHNNREKRIQTGIPKSFRATIFHIYSGSELPWYVSSMNSKFNLIDDLERACYLVDSGIQPDVQNNITALTNIELRKGSKFVDGPYFTLTIFKNGNVKVDFKDLELLKRLNHWGQKGNRLK
jgi:hypothetical protein